MRSAVRAATGTFLVLAVIGAAARQEPEAPDVRRGRQTESRQRAYHARLSAFYEALSHRLRLVAPDLLDDVEPPSPATVGYQLLPRIVPDTPPASPATSLQVSRFSWEWSETLIDREMEALSTLERDLLALGEGDGTLPDYRALVDAYRRAETRRRRVDSNIGHTGFWQRAIGADRARFDRGNTLLDAALARQAIEDSLRKGTIEALAAVARAQGLDAAQPGAALRELLARRAETLRQQVRAFTGTVRVPTYVSFHEVAPEHWELSVPVYTDIGDAAFLESFRTATERAWHVRDGDREWRVLVEVRIVTPEQLYCRNAADGPSVDDCNPPAQGAAIDVRGHARRFPGDGAVLTTGGASLHVTTGRAIVLNPFDVKPSALAHEFGHVLGFDDGYVRGYRDLGAEGFEVRERVLDRDDIMSSSSTGTVGAHHFEALVGSRPRGAVAIAEDSTPQVGW